MGTVPPRDWPVPLAVSTEGPGKPSCASSGPVQAQGFRVLPAVSRVGPAPRDATPPSAVMGSQPSALLPPVHHGSACPRLGGGRPSSSLAGGGMTCSWGPGPSGTGEGAPELLCHQMPVHRHGALSPLSVVNLFLPHPLHVTSGLSRKAGRYLGSAGSRSLWYCEDQRDWELVILAGLGDWQGGPSRGASLAGRRQNT